MTIGSSKKSKINYISTYSMPSQRAVGIQIMNTCSALAKEDWDVNLWISKKQGEFNESEIFSYYNVQKNFKIKPIYPRRFGRNYFFNTLIYLAKLKRRISAESIVYSREQLTGLFFNNFVFEVHYLPEKPNLFHRLLWRRAVGFVVLTAFLKEELVKAGFDENIIHIAPDAVGEAHLSAGISEEGARKELNLPIERKIVAYVGKYQTPFAESKGVDELIKSFPEVKRQVSSAFLLIVGVGNRYLSEVQEKIKQAGADFNEVMVIGHAPQESVVKYLRSADVLVISPPWSLYNAYQTSPMKLFEYMAARKPVVASNLPSIAEIAGKNGAHFVEPGNIDDLSEGIIRVLEDNDYAESLASEAYERVKDFTWSNRAIGISNFLKNVTEA